MSGGSLRSAEMKREKSSACFIGSTEVTRSRKQRIELAADPRPRHRIGGFCAGAKRTRAGTVRQYQMIGRAQLCNPVTNQHRACRLMLGKTQNGPTIIAAQQVR